VSAEIDARMASVADAVERLDTIPGVGKRTAETLLAEMGTDMGHFPSAAHLASWAALCPGNNESGGKRLSGRTRKANPWLRAVLVEAAQAAGRTRGSVLRAQHQRLAARVGSKRATVAVAHRLLVTAYHLLRDPTAQYREAAVRPTEEGDREAVVVATAHRRAPEAKQTAREFAGSAWRRIERGRPHTASYWARVAIALDPSYSDGYRMLALAHLRAGDPAGAHRVLARGLAVAPDDPNLHVARGHVAWEQGDARAAAAAYRRAVALGSTERDVLARVGTDAKQPDEPYGAAPSCRPA
jgi:hypothetical protein